MRELSWTVLRADADPHETPDGVENMARDDTLARSAKPGEGVVRFYRWRRPTLSFGRNEPATELYLPEPELRARGVDLVRRPTGGRAVLHDHELTYAVVAPIDAFDSLRGAYRRINGALVRGLQELGVEAVQAGGEGVVGGSIATPPLDAGPCFQSPADGEVTFGGRKLVGSAQARIGRFILQHGSILLRDDQSRLADLRRVSSAESPGEENAPATLTEALGTLPAVADLIDALSGGFRAALGGDWRTAPGTGSFPENILTERRRLYASPEWTWRR